MKAFRRLGLLLLLSIPGLGAAKPQPAAHAPPRLPAGLADPDGRTGFFPSADESIEAVDLSNGKVLWQTHEAQRPLLIEGDHLLAQAGVKRNRLRILRLDCKRNGECDFESDPVVFPAWVVTGPAPGHSFTSNWRLQGHQLRLDWEANTWHVGPAHPSSKEALAARKSAAGVAVIDLRTGRVELRPAGSAQPAAKSGKSKADAPSLPEHLEKKSLRWQGFVGKHWKVLALEEEKGFQRFVLYSWDPAAAKELPPKELLRGQRLLARVTLDERVLCLREGSPSPEERFSMMPKKSSGYWSLFAVDTGKAMGRIPVEAGTYDIAILGKRVFYLVAGEPRGSLDRGAVQPQTLKAVDLVSGKQLWQRPVAGRSLAPPP
jgi:hypothetical protein